MDCFVDKSMQVFNALPDGHIYHQVLIGKVDGFFVIFVREPRDKARRLGCEGIDWINEIPEFLHRCAVKRCYHPGYVNLGYRHSGGGLINPQGIGLVSDYGVPECPKVMVQSTQGVNRIQRTSRALHVVFCLVLNLALRSVYLNNDILL